MVLQKETRKRGCSSAGRAPALQAGGHGFEPHHLHHPTVSGPKARGRAARVARETPMAKVVRECNMMDESIPDE